MPPPLRFEDLDHDDEKKSPRFKGTAWRNARIPERGMKIVGPLGELGVRQRVETRKNRPSIPRKETLLSPAELSTSEPYDRPASAPLMHPSSRYRRQARTREGPLKQDDVNMKVLDRLHEESCMKRDKLDAAHGAPLPMETLQEWESEHRHDRKEIDKLHAEHTAIKTKISAQADGINRLIEQRSADTKKHGDDMSFLVAQHERALAGMSAQHALTVARLLESHEDQLTTERAKSKALVTECHQQYKLLELQFTQEYEHRLSDVTARYEERIASLVQFHEWQLKDRVDSLKQEVYQLHEEAERQVNPMEEEDAGKFQLKMEEMQKMHKFELEEVKRQRAAEVAALQVQYDLNLGREGAARSQVLLSAETAREIEILERKVQSLTEEVTRWRRCAEEASQAASKTEYDLKVMEKRYDELKLQLMQGAQDEVAAKEACLWERKFLELQSRYDQLKLQVSQRGEDPRTAEEAILDAKEARATAAHWERQVLEMQYRYDELKLDHADQMRSMKSALFAESAGQTEALKHDIILESTWQMESQATQYRSDMENMMKDNHLLRKRISELESRAGASTAASTPLPENRSYTPLPENRSLYSTPQPGLSSSSSTTPALTMDPPSMPQDFSGLVWDDMQKVLGDMSTEDLLRLTGRSK